MMKARAGHAKSVLDLQIAEPADEPAAAPDERSLHTGFNANDGWQQRNSIVQMSIEKRIGIRGKSNFSNALLSDSRKNMID